MIEATLAGAVILGVPLALVAWVALRRQPRIIRLFALAMVLVGLGYLMSTGATADIARRLAPSLLPVKT